MRGQYDVVRVHELIAGISKYRATLWGVVIGLILALLTRTAFFQVSRISTAGMAPEIQQGDYLLIYKAAYAVRKPQRGQIVEYQMEPGFVPSERLRVGRIVGLPGEMIEVRGGRLCINGDTVVESYVESRAGCEMPVLTIPPDHFCIMADNREASMGDSHDFGAVPFEYIRGVALFCYYPFNRARVYREPGYAPGPVQPLGHR